MNIYFTADEISCFVTELFSAICKKAGKTPSKIYVGDISVSPDVKTVIRAYYRAIYGSSLSKAAEAVFANDWAEYGPAVDTSMNGFTVHLEDGWCE